MKVTISSQMLLLRQVSETLAGRASLLDLWPFALIERAAGSHAPPAGIDAICERGKGALIDMASAPCSDASRIWRGRWEQHVRWDGSAECGPGDASRGSLCRVDVRKQKGAPAPRRIPKRQWRDYRTPAGGRPVKDFIGALSDEDAAGVAAAMREVRDQGVAAAKHLRGEIYEINADTKDYWIRILFAQTGSYSQVLLTLSGFKKKTNKTPAAELELAEKRLASWKARGKRKKGPVRKS